MNFIGDLDARGLIHQVTDLSIGTSRNLSFYMGVDPTAQSLHLGSLMAVMMVDRMRQYGHLPHIVLGGVTGLIGDPSGKSAERVLIDESNVAFNTQKICDQINMLLGVGTKIHNNSEWLSKMTAVSFLRDYGKYFSVNALLTRDSVKSRLENREQGISFTEFSYSLLQAIDFLEMHARFGCTLQIGGSDQFGNIVSGIDLIRRVKDHDAYGMTFPLLTKADGAKFGKTASGALWLDAKMTLPFDLFHYLNQTSDDDIEKLLNALTMLTTKGIREIMMSHRESQEKRLAQKVLCEAVISYVHGPIMMNKISMASEAMYGQTTWTHSQLEMAHECMHGTTVTKTDRQKNILDYLAMHLCESRTEAKNALKQGSVYVNGMKVNEAGYLVKDFMFDEYAVLRRGKNYFVVRSVDSASARSMP